MTHTANAHLVDLDTADTIDVFGPTMQFLVPPRGDCDPCIMRSSVPAGVVVPLHSHADPETFIGVSGQMEGLVYTDDEISWVPVGAGDVFHVPGDVKHAWRNRSDSPAVITVVSTSRIGRFFLEIAVPLASPPTPEALERFAATSARYGYWLATPEENRAIGLELPPMP